MARIDYDLSGFEEKLGALASRENIRRIVEAGSKAAVETLQERTMVAGHVSEGGGSLMRGIKAGPLHEDLGSAWQYVYPQGTGSHGQDLTVVGFVINYGRGNKKVGKTGDHFITGNKKQLDQAVQAAMQAEADRILQNTMR